MLTPTPEQLAQALTALPGLQIARAYSLGHSRLMINAIWHDQAISFVAHVTEVLDGQVPESPPVHRGRQVPAIYHTRTRWTERELCRRGLPRYWSRAWLEASLARLGSYEAMERFFGYRAATLSQFATTQFGMRRRPDRAQQREAVRRDYLAGEHMLVRLAERHDVSVSNVHNWVRDLRR